MLKEIGSYDAKTKLPQILRLVEGGESFTITNRGKPVADLIPSQSNDQLKIQAAISSILAAQKRTVSNEELIALRLSGRK